MTRKSRYPLLSLALLVLLVTFARRPIRAQEPFSFIIDEDVNPRRPTLEPLADGAERPLGAIQSTDGSHDDFLLDEVILYAPDQASLESFMATYEASLLSGGALPAPPDSISTDDIRWEAADSDYYHLRLNLELADLSEFEASMTELGFRGEYRFSSEAMLRLSAIIAHEQIVNGVSVFPNLPVELSDADCVICSTEEHPNSPGYRDGFDYAWANDAQLQVTRAWQFYDLLELNRPVKLAFVDQGYALNADFPANVPQYDFIGDDYNVTGRADYRNQWHGAGSASTAAAIHNNRYGSLGTGGQVARPLFFHIDLTLSGIGQGLRTAVYWGADVVNMSVAAYCNSACRLFGLFSGSSSLVSAGNLAHSRGVLMVASANNDEKNLDNETVLPCELNKVICVGAINRASKMAVRKNPTGGGWGSNYGSSVDIWGVGDRIDTTPNPASGSALASHNGTSAASPYVAGIVALMRAVDPNLTADQALNTLQSTANSSPDRRVTSYINAYATLKATAARINVTPQGDIHEPNDVISSAAPLTSSTISGTIAPGDHDIFALTLTDYSDVTISISYQDTTVTANQLAAEFVNVTYTASNGSITISRQKLRPGTYYLRLYGSSGDALNCYNVTINQTAATLAPDRFDDQQPAGEARNDSLAHAAIITEVLGADSLLPSLSLDDLNFHLNNDVDYFTIRLTPPIDPLTGQGECLPAGDPRLADPNTRQGAFTIQILPAVARSFNITLYRNGAPLTGYTNRSGLSLTLPCPRNIYGPNETITFAVHDPAGRNEYDIALWYRRWDSLIPTPEWLLDPPQFNRVIPSILDRARFIYPLDPLMLEQLFAGVWSGPLPAEYLIFERPTEGDYWLDIGLPAGAQLQVNLLSENGEHLAEAELNPETGGLRLSAPELPAGRFVLQIQGESLSTIFSLSSGG